MGKMILSKSKADFDQLVGFDKSRGLITNDKKGSEFVKVINRRPDGKYEYFITTMSRVISSGIKYTEIGEQNGKGKKGITKK